MRLIAAQGGKILTLDSDLSPHAVAGNERAFSSGLAELDGIAPGGAFARGAIHELLTEPGNGKAMFLAMTLARELNGGQAATERRRDEAAKDFNTLSLGPFVPSSRASSLSPSPKSIVWCDPAHTLYPPALAGHGFPLDRLFLLHPKLPDPNGRELIWAMAECLRCKGVGAVIGAVPRLSRVQARRLQLAAETGGGVGLLLRHVGKESLHHAAASRWLIHPAPGSRTVQRWTIQLLHGHGGRVGQTLCLEHCRETNHLRAAYSVADRSTAKKQAAG